MAYTGFEWVAGGPPTVGRQVAAVALRTVARALGRLARRLRLRPVRRIDCMEPILEFHAEAGAPEGALYVNGQLVGQVLGVRRL